MNTETNADHADADAFLRGLRKQSQWWLCCYGEWLEYSGARVIFDRCYRPICRVQSDGSYEVVPPDQFIRYRKQRFYHSGFGTSPTPEVRDLVRRFIARFDLTDELRKRHDLLRRKKLPRCNREAARHAA